MDGVGNVTECAWKGAHQGTIGHKAGYHHVALSTGSWQYFGFEGMGELLYVFTVLAFCWCSAPASILHLAVGSGGAIPALSGYPYSDVNR